MENFSLIRRDSGVAYPKATEAESLSVPRDGQDDVAGLFASWAAVLRHKALLTGVVLASTIVAVVFTFLQTPMYRSRTSIEVDPANEYFMNLREIDPALAARTGESYLQTQTQILRSASLIRKTLARLGRPAPEPNGPAQSVLRRIYRQPDNPSDAYERAVLRIEENLTVKPVHQGHLIDLTLDYPDRAFVADFLNALTASFVDAQKDLRNQTAQLTRERLNEQLEEVKRQLEQSERALQDYARNFGLILTPEKSSAAEEELRRLQQELANARAQRILKQSQRETAASSAVASVPEVLDNNTLRDYQVKLIELRRQLAELEALFTPNHPEVKQVKAQIQEIESAFAAQRRDVVDRIRNEYEASLRRQNLLAAAVDHQTAVVAAQSANSVRYNMLHREVETNRTVYDAMLQRVRSAGLASAMELPNIRIIDAALTPERPFKPHLVANMAVWAIGGMVLGVILALVREKVDRRIQSPYDVRSHMTIHQLGVVPHVEFSEMNSPGSRMITYSAAEASPSGSLWQQNALLADAFRAALTSILCSRDNGGLPRVIVVTSPTPRDGKTTVTCNLGKALSEIKRRVLLIDGDTRNPTLHRVFGIPNDVGLTSVLQGERELDDSMLHRVWPGTDAGPSSGSEAGAPAARAAGLYVLPRGPACETSSALFYSTGMHDLLLRLQTEFDAVLIDTPPVLQMPDARVLGLNAEGVILVLRAGQTTPFEAREAAMRLASDRIPVLGWVLNAFDARGGLYKYYAA